MLDYDTFQISSHNNFVSRFSPSVESSRRKLPAEGVRVSDQGSSACERQLMERPCLLIILQSLDGLLSLYEHRHTPNQLQTIRSLRRP